MNDGGKAGFTALFIRRPILALVLNTLIIIAGLAAFTGVEIRDWSAFEPAVEAGYRATMEVLDKLDRPVTELRRRPSRHEAALALQAAG